MQDIKIPGCLATKRKKMREIVKYKLNKRKVEGNSNIIAQNLCH